MANLIIQENGVARTRPAVTGEEITIKTPCGCSDVTGVQINGVVFPFYDASGNSLADMTGLFAKDSLIRVLIDADKKRAYILNADTNAYLESQFANFVPLSGGTVIPNGSDLDTYQTNGNYKCVASGAPATLLNCPTKDAFHMVVGNAALISSNYKFQEITDVNGDVYWRWINQSDGKGWRTWRHKFDDSMVIPIENGGTGAVTSADALAKLGAVALDGSTKMTGALEITKENPFLRLNGTGRQIFLQLMESSGKLLLATRDSADSSKTNSLELYTESMDIKSVLRVGASGSFYDVIHAGNKKDYVSFKTTATIPANWTKRTDGGIGYSQTLNIAGIKKTDDPIIALAMTDSQETNQTLMEAWNLVTHITTFDGTVILYCYEDAPAVAIPILIQCMR